MAEGLGPEEGTTAGELVAAASSFSTTGAAEKAGRRSVFFVEAAPLLLLLLLLPVLGTKACVPTEVRARMTNKNKGDTTGSKKVRTNRITIRVSKSSRRTSHGRHTKYMYIVLK